MSKTDTPEKTKPDASENVPADTMHNEGLQRYDRLIERVGDRFVIFSHSLSGEVLYVSGNTMKVFGLSPEDIIGQTWQSSANWLPGAIEFAEGQFEAMLEGKYDYVQHSLQFIHPNGSKRTIKISEYLINDLEGQALGFEGIAEDITEQTELTEQIAINEARLRIALEFSHQDWFDLNCQTGEITVGPTYPSMLGYLPSEFHPTYQRWLDAIHPDDLPIAKMSIEAARTSAEVNEFEYRRKSKSGDWIWFNATGKVYEWDSQGNPLRIIGVQANISRRKRQGQEGADLLRKIEAIIREMAVFHAASNNEKNLSLIQSPLANTQLSARQREVVKLVATGLTSAQIALKLHISYQTVLTHRRNIMSRLNLHSVADLTRYVIENKLM